MTAFALTVERLLPPVAAEDRAALLRLEQGSQLRPAGWDSLSQEIVAAPTSAIALVARTAQAGGDVGGAPFGPPERGAVVGFASARRMVDAVHVVRLVVSPQHRRAGLGTRLFDGLRRWADAVGCPTVTLEVRADNAAALALYHRAGLVEVGRRAGYYPDGTDAIVCSLIAPTKRA